MRNLNAFEREFRLKTLKNFSPSEKMSPNPSVENGVSNVIVRVADAFFLESSTAC